MTNLNDKVVVITGAANGLGKALATEFYRQGCHLALIDVNYRGLEITKDKFEISEQRVTIHQADISNEQSFSTTRLKILSSHHHIDILVNNAGISISQNFEQTDLADYKRLFDVNFWGTVYCTKIFLPDLKIQSNSRIVNIISDFAFIGFPGKTAYSSSKSAVLGFTNCLKTELADTNVRVCFVVPPPLDTGLVRNSKHISEKKRENEARFLMENGLPLNKTARAIVKQITRGKYRIIIGAMMFWIDLLARFFPTTLNTFIGTNKHRINFI